MRNFIFALVFWFIHHFSFWLNWGTLGFCVFALVNHALRLLVFVRFSFSNGFLRLFLTTFGCGFSFLGSFLDFLFNTFSLSFFLFSLSFFSFSGLFGFGSFSFLSLSFSFQSFSFFFCFLLFFQILLLLAFLFTLCPDLSLFLFIFNVGQLSNSLDMFLFRSDGLVPLKVFNPCNSLISCGEFTDPLFDVVFVKVELNALVFNSQHLQVKKIKI